MLIELLKDLNPDKGWVKGTTKDWIRPLITEITRQLAVAALVERGHKEEELTDPVAQATIECPEEVDWYRFANQDAQPVTAIKRGRKKKPEEAVDG